MAEELGDGTASPKLFVWTFIVIPLSQALLTIGVELLGVLLNVLFL